MNKKWFQIVVLLSLAMIAHIPQALAQCDEQSDWANASSPGPQPRLPTPPRPATWQLCTDDPDKLYVAVAYLSVHGWRTVGWFPVDVSTCRKITGVMGSRAYWHLFGSRNVTEKTLCVNPTSKFNVKSDSRCATGFRQASFNTQRMSMPHTRTYVSRGQ